MLRAILNDHVPGIVDAQGDIVWPDTSHTSWWIIVDWSPCDLTGLGFLNGEEARIFFDPGVEVTACPALPNVIYTELRDYPGTYLPSPHPNTILEIFTPTQLQDWSLVGTPSESSMSVSLIDFPAHIAWPSPITNIGTLEIIGCAREDAPVLGDNVSHFWVHNSAMTELPEIPVGMTSLNIQNVPGLESGWAVPQQGTLTDVTFTNMEGLTSLHGMPSSAIVAITQCPLLTSIEFPQSAEEIHLYELPSLQTVTVLPVDLLHLDWGLYHLCVPYLPSSLEEVIAEVCVPNQPPLCPPLELCTILNSECPDPNPVVSGHVFYDLNDNGTQEAEEPNGVQVIVRSLSSGHFTGTDLVGNYVLGLPIGAHEVVVESTYANWEAATITADLDQPGMHLTDADFALRTDSAIIYDRSIVWTALFVPRPGFERNLVFQWSSLGLFSEPSTITIELDAWEEFISSTLPGTTVDGNLITIEIPADDGWSGSGQIRVRTLIEAPLGTLLGSTITIGPVAGDHTPEDNTAGLPDDIVVGSYDPNDKQAFPAAFELEEVQGDTLVEYLIRFQNTGTFLAERVVITDTLSDRLRWETFRMIQASHDHVWYMANGVVHFIFDGIMLPDSTSNEPNSHGFVRFSIRPATDLVLGEEVVNVANIYFDFNAPVITDPCVLSVLLPTGEEAFAPERTFSVHPVPATDRIQLGLLDGRFRGELLTMDGRLLRQLGTLVHGSGVDLAGLVPGSYLLRLQGEQGRILHTRFIKQ